LSIVGGPAFFGTEPIMTTPFWTIATLFQSGFTLIRKN
jgi:hypothetical protein